jgi:hypothetical protein
MLSASTNTGTTVTVWKTITIPTTLPTGVLNVSYNNTLVATGGNGTYSTYTVVSGALPTNLSLSTGGVLSGTPTGATPTTYNFTVRATDSNGLYGDQAYSVTIVNTHNVTKSITNGSFNPVTSPIAVTHGTTATFTVNANTGYHITGITADANCAATYTPATYTNGTGGVASYSFTTGAVNGDCTVTATIAINKFDITVTPDAHSKFTGYALNTPHTYAVDYNSSQAMTFDADTTNGYHLTGITNSCGGTATAAFSNAVNGPWTANATFTTSGVVTNGVAPNCGISATSTVNVYSITPTVTVVP